jgi:hypothetical protein
LRGGLVYRGVQLGEQSGEFTAQPRAPPPRPGAQQQPVALSDPPSDLAFDPAAFSPSIGHTTKVRELTGMSKVKNISGGPRYVPLLDREVADGEVVDVPDTQPAHAADNPLPIVWPESTWEPVTGKPAKTDSGKAAS